MIGIMNHEVERIRKDKVVSYIPALHLPEGTVENCGKFQSR
jgi:hypothetical protein